MAADHSSLLALALVTIIVAFPLALTASPAEPALALGKRRAAVTHVDALRVENLHYDCSAQSWTQCLAWVNNLRNESHPINVGISDCLNRNDPYAPSPSPPQATDTVSYSNSNTGSDSVQQTSGDPGSDQTSNSTNSATAGAKPKCPINGDEKRRIRSDTYCALLFLVDQLVGSFVRMMCRLRDEHCMLDYHNPSFRTPQQILESIRLWHEKMISTHKRCCEDSAAEGGFGTRFTRDFDVLYGYSYELYFRPGDSAIMCPFYNSRRIWDRNLSNIVLFVHMVELMQGLGRRKTCLRGCVSEAQVLCTNLVPYIL